MMKTRIALQQNGADAISASRKPPCPAEQHPDAASDL